MTDTKDVASPTEDEGLKRMLKEDLEPEELAKVLDAATFTDLNAKKAVRGPGSFLSHEELLKRLGR